MVISDKELEILMEDGRISTQHFVVVFVLFVVVVVVVAGQQEGFVCCYCCCTILVDTYGIYSLCPLRLVGQTVAGLTNLVW